MTAAALLTVSACGGSSSNDVRGHGLTDASLPASAQARIYEAAERRSFDIDNTSLLLDRRLLPRTVGLAPAGMIPDAVVSAMRSRGAIRGTCQPPLTGTRGTAHCQASEPGYVVRFSPVFSGPGDTVQVYLYSQKYDTPRSGLSQTLRFERAYQVVRHGDDWEAVREGSVPRSVRGEGS